MYGSRASSLQEAPESLRMSKGVLQELLQALYEVKETVEDIWGALQRHSKGVWYVFRSLKLNFDKR